MKNEASWQPISVKLKRLVIISDIYSKLGN